MPRDLLAKAEAAFAHIECTKPKDMLLHGDLHHENILWDERSGWLAIDPKGVLGAPCLEVGRFVQNQLPHELPAEGLAALVHERIQVFSSELGYPVATIAASALVDCVLSHCWSLEEQALTEDWYRGVELARLLCQMYV